MIEIPEKKVSSVAEKIEAKQGGAAEQPALQPLRKPAVQHAEKRTASGAGKLLVSHSGMKIDRR
jgi:hypothetical protein